MVIGSYMALMTRLGQPVLRTIAGGTGLRPGGLSAHPAGVGQNQDLIIIGALMALVPASP